MHDPSLACFSTTLLVSDLKWDVGLSPSLLSWLSLVSACGLMFWADLGLQPMPGLMSSELFPPNSRAFCKVGSKYMNLR